MQVPGLPPFVGTAVVVVLTRSMTRYRYSARTDQLGVNPYSNPAPPTAPYLVWLTETVDARPPLKRGGEVS